MTLHRPSLPIGLALAPALLVGAATANDSMASVGAGGVVLMKTNDLAMEREVLFISEDRVAVDYVFRNLTGHTITTTVAFPMPFSRAMGGPFRASFDPEGFVVQAAGREVHPFWRARAVREDTGLDITDELRRLGLSDEDIWSARLTSSKRRELAQQGLADDESTEVPGDMAYRWQAAKVYYWEQTFPAHRAIQVHHEYRPFAGQAYAPTGQMGSRVHDFEALYHRDYCVDAATERQLSKLGSEKDWPTLRAVDYVLTTGANWAAPVKAFKLILRMKRPQDVVSLCFPGSLKRADPTTFVSELVDFTPTADLSVVFATGSGAKPMR